MYTSIHTHIHIHIYISSLIAFHAMLRAHVGRLPCYNGRLITIMWCDDFWQFSNQVIVFWYTFTQKQSPDGINDWLQSHHMIVSAFRHMIIIIILWLILLVIMVVITILLLLLLLLKKIIIITIIVIQNNNQTRTDQPLFDPTNHFLAARVSILAYYSLTAYTVNCHIKRLSWVVPVRGSDQQTTLRPPE